MRRSDARSADREQGSLLAELTVAAGLMVLSVVIVGATLSGPVRGIAGLGQPQAGLEGVDELAVAFVNAVRAARPDLGRPAVLAAEPARLLVALGHLRDGGSASSATWELSLEEDAAMIDGRVVLVGVDATRTRITYRDAAGVELSTTEGGLDVTTRSRIALIELRVAVVDPMGAAEVDVTHRAALRVVGPLA